LNSIVHRVVTRGLAALVFAAPLAFQPALAQDKAMSSSQSKMATCSKQNKGLKGDEYKKAQSDCLKGETAAAATPMTQQQKMAMCSKQNKGKKGDDYKKAQSDCLKG
jgi:hypothetical protein